MYRVGPDGIRKPRLLDGTRSAPEMEQAACPVCGELAELDTYDSTRPDGEWTVTVYRCPNNARKLTQTEQLAGKKLTGHPIHKTEVRKESVPKLSPELQKRIEAAPISKIQLSRAIGKCRGFVHNVIARGDISEEAVELLEKKLDQLEQSPPPPEVAPEPVEVQEIAITPEVREHLDKLLDFVAEQSSEPKPAAHFCPYELAKQLESIAQRILDVDRNGWTLVNYAVERALLAHDDKLKAAK